MGHFLLNRRISLALLDVPQGAPNSWIVKDAPQQGLAIVISQVEPDDGRLHLFTDVCINTQRLSHTNLSNGGGQPTCS